MFQTQLKTGSGTIQEQEKEAKSLKEDLRKCDGGVEHLREEVKRLESVKEELKICNNDKDRLNKDRVDQQEQAGREARKAQDALNQEVAKVKEENERLSRRLDELQEELDKEKEQVKKAEAEVGSLKADQLQSGGHVKVPCTSYSYSCTPHHCGGLCAVQCSGWAPCNARHCYALYGVQCSGHRAVQCSRHRAMQCSAVGTMQCSNLPRQTPPLHLAREGGLGPGQLADVDTGAVSVVRKETRGEVAVAVKETLKVTTHILSYNLIAL